MEVACSYMSVQNDLIQITIHQVTIHHIGLSLIYCLMNLVYDDTE